MNYDREGRKIVSSVGIARNGNLPSDAGNPPYMVVEYAMTATGSVVRYSIFLECETR